MIAPLDLDTQQEAEHLTIKVTGTITHQTTDILRGYLRQELSQHPGATVQVDLHRCTCIDTDGLLALDLAQQSARSRGGNLYLFDVPKAITRLLRQDSLDHLVDPKEDRTIGAMHGTAVKASETGHFDAAIPEADSLEQ